MSLKVLCVAICLVSVVYAKITPSHQCPEVSQDACTVSEVRIDPCKEYPCKLKKRTHPSISFTFTPNFAASNVKAGLFWPSPDGKDVPFSELQNADGCQFTSCPLESGKTQELNYSLTLGKLLPVGTYDFKWKLWNDEDPSQACCFVTKIQLKN